MEFHKIPSYLLRYTSKQDYSMYTFEDQSVWRFVMRQLYDFLKVHAHSVYEDGLKKTGLKIDSIPKISDMDEMLKGFGWRAVPVSGFIPPAAFMSFQANRILPIACEIRSMDHILYTPAPDIIHEAAGHAPILIDPDFTNYLSSYGEVASKAIISSEDLALYEAIRDLSDIKEDSQSSPEMIKKAEEHLDKVGKSISYVSEAQYLGRMNWWTAEYGLIGSLESPKIYGAGLLSSVGEAKNSLTRPKHLPFSVDCLEYNYDITEQQPQLFVVKEFNDLINALDEIKNDMAFHTGGIKGLNKAVEAKSVCTVVFENEDTYSGIIENFEAENDHVKKIKILAPCLILNKEISSEPVTLDFRENPLKVKSVYGGPSSYDKYPEYTDFVAKKVQKNTPNNQASEELLKKIREQRAKRLHSFDKLSEQLFDTCPEHWLAALELLELKFDVKIFNQLKKIKQNSTNEEIKTCIELGLKLIK